MTSDDVRTAVKRHRRAAVYGGVVGLALLIAYVAYAVIQTPPVPDLDSAPPLDVVSYIANPRGLAKQPDIEQQRFLEQWEDVVMRDPQRKEALRACFEGIDDETRERFSDAFFDNVKRAFLEDAKRFNRLPVEERYAFLSERTGAYRERVLFLKDVAAGFKKQLPRTQDEGMQWLMKHTTAEERDVGTPYAEALKRIQEQLKKEGRAPEAQASAPTSPQDGTAQ
jgi:hypothetical protein